MTQGITTVPHYLVVHGYTGLGTVAPVRVIQSFPLPGEDDGAPPPFDLSDGDDAGSDGSDGILADFPQPPGYSFVSGANSGPSQDRLVQMPNGNFMWGAHAPFVSATPILDRPAKVDVQIYPGWFEVRASGSNGEGGIYRIPMMHPSDLGMLVANFITCSISFIKRVATVGFDRAPMLSVDVVARDPVVAASLSESDGVSETIIGRPMASLPAAP